MLIGPIGAAHGDTHREADAGALDAPRAERSSDGTRVSVIGAAKLNYIPSPRDDVRLRVRAGAVIEPESGSPFSVRAWGRAKLYHHVANGDVTMWASGPVDCVSVGGRSATVSIVVDQVSPALTDAGWLGTRVGFSVYEGHGGEAARGGATGPYPVDELPKCMATAPSMAAASGGFRIATDDPHGVRQVDPAGGASDQQ